jgi:hypothetical protein
MLYDPLQTESCRKLACRHCNEEEVPREKQSHSAALLGLDCSALQKEIETIENCGHLVDDVSFYCEDCNKTSVVSYKFYRKTRRPQGARFVFKNRITYRTQTPCELYTGIAAYYSHLFTRFKNQHDFM